MDQKEWPKMKIIVDADACPVKEIIETLARRKRIKVIMVSNYSQDIRSDYAETVIVDKEAEAADITIEIGRASCRERV